MEIKKRKSHPLKDAICVLPPLFHLLTLLYANNHHNYYLQNCLGFSPASNSLSTLTHSAHGHARIFISKLLFFDVTCQQRFSVVQKEFILQVKLVRLSGIFSCHFQTRINRLIS